MQIQWKANYLKQQQHIMIVNRLVILLQLTSLAYLSNNKLWIIIKRKPIIKLASRTKKPCIKQQTVKKEKKNMLKYQKWLRVLFPSTPELRLHSHMAVQKTDFSDEIDSIRKFRWLATDKTNNIYVYVCSTYMY